MEIILIYILAFIIYSFILVGFKKVIYYSTEKLGKLCNKYFLIIVVLLMLSSVAYLFNSKDNYPLSISIMSLSLSLMAFHKNSKQDTRDNIEYYIYKINMLNKLKDTHFIKEDEYNSKIKKLKERFDDNKDILDKKL